MSNVSTGVDSSYQTFQVTNPPVKQVNIEAFPLSLREDKSRQPQQTKRWWQFGGDDFSHVSVGAVTIGISETSSLSDAPLLNKNVNNVYEASEVIDLYRPVEGYEGAHRFDPTAVWTDMEEKSLVRKLDWRIALPVCVMFFALQLDRGNITQALSDNMLGDLNLTTNDYNNGMTIFYCSFLFAELPSQLISKRLGPDNWIPIQMITWSIVAAGQAALNGRVSFYVSRFLLGLIEGGFIPDIVLYLSYFYKNSELPKRLSWFWTSYQMTNVIGAFFAYGILHLRGNFGLQQGWRYLFAIEGVTTSAIGIFTWLYLPASPTETSRSGLKGLLRPKQGWFTAEEEVIMVTRILRDDPGKATMHNRQGIGFNLFWEALIDYDMWPIYILGLTWSIPMTPATSYITLTCKALGFDTFQTNLLTIPASILFIIHLLFWTWAAEKMNQRLLVGLISQLWCLPLLLALEFLPVHFPNADTIKYLLSTLLIGYPYPHAVIVALTSRNSGSVRTRTVGSSLYNMAVQASSVFASQIYRDDDKPYYYRGNKVLLAILTFNIVAFIASKVYYEAKNAMREKIWGAMSREQRISYLASTEDEGNKRLDFRFAS